MGFLHQARILPVVVVAVAALTLGSIVAIASSKDDIAYPVPELGGCKSETECRAFCDARDDIGRVKACLLFARLHKLLSGEELDEAERYVVRIGIARGPGGCRNEEACAAYCEDTRYLRECIDFAEQYRLRSSDEITEGRRLLAALENGAKLPGGCRNRNECLAYCDDSSHMGECVLFAEAAGFISSEEAAEAKKIIPLLEQGGRTPGNCARKAACEAYCADVSHLDECLEFAERVDLLSPEELADAKRFAPYIKRGETPGGCSRKEECEAYCEDPAHLEECVGFAEKVGMLSKEEAELARKFGGKGPGGCQSRQACEELCTKAENQEVCITFAEEHGLTEEIAAIEQKMRGEVEKTMRVCAEKPSCSEFITCLQALRGPGSGLGVGGEEDLPHELKERLTACIAEETQKSIAEDARVCAQKPCSEMITCLQGLQRGAEANDRESDASDLPEDVQGRLNLCITEIETQAKTGIPTGGNSGAESGDSSELSGEDSEQYRKQYEAEYQRQYEEQVKQQLDCSLFEPAPSCDYVGAQGSQNYNFCKLCFPNK